MNRTMMSTLVCVYAVGVSALAQEITHERGGAPGRGDVHSKGWDAAVKFKGAPIPPRFPEVGRDARRVVFDNGLVLFVRGDRRLPLIQMHALIRSGACYETAEEYGVADYVGSLMRSGGTAKWKPQELDDRLAFLAANLSAGVGEDSADVSLDLLSKDAGEGIAIFADVIRNPAFDEGRLALAKRRAVNSLLHRNDNPGGVLARELNSLFFPETHPSGRSLTPTQLAAVTRARIRAFHSRFFRPENTWISVTGDFDEKEMVDRVHAAFDDWKRVGEPVAPPARFEAQPRPGVFFVGKELNQSSVSVAHPGIDRANPDRYAVQLMNSILGGGSFSSRITESVRSNEGLAYSARSAFPTGGREPDLFQATVQTKTESTGRAIELLVEEIKKMQAGPISKNEFDTAKESALYGMVFRNSRPADAVNRLMRLEFDGLPLDQDRLDFEGLSKVTPEAVVSAAKKYLRPEQLTILVVGNGPAVSKALTTFGEPKPITPAEYDLNAIREAEANQVR
jgi:predicted Zn-dependent peptidase